jgi:hypothetical protein
MSATVQRSSSSICLPESFSDMFINQICVQVINLAKLYILSERRATSTDTCRRQAHMIDLCSDIYMRLKSELRRTLSNSDRVAKMSSRPYTSVLPTDWSRYIRAVQSIHNAFYTHKSQVSLTEVATGNDSDKLGPVMLCPGTAFAGGL